MSKYSFGTVKNIVEYILNADVAARNSDQVLYLDVVRLLHPGMENAPFYRVITDCRIPGFETIRRARQKVQENNPNLRASDNVEAGRMLKEEEIREAVTHG